MLIALPYLPKLIRRATLAANAFRRHKNLAGFTDRALDWLEKAVDNGCICYPFLSEIDPFLENIRGITCKDSSSPVIRRCEFRNNYMPDGWEGGGIGVGAGIYCTVGIDI